MNPPPCLGLDEFWPAGEPVEAVVKGEGEGEGIDPFVWLPWLSAELGLVEGVCVPDGLLLGGLGLGERLGVTVSWDWF